MKTKQLSFEFPYRSNADGVVKLEQFLRQNLLEIKKNITMTRIINGNYKS